MRLIDADKIVYKCRVDNINCNGECDTCYYRSVSRNEIENQPTEKPVIYGKWLNVSKPIRNDYLGDVNYAECSVCHSIRVADYFCSCCGADMRRMKESGEITKGEEE